MLHTPAGLAGTSLPKDYISRHALPTTCPTTSWLPQDYSSQHAAGCCLLCHLTLWGHRPLRPPPLTTTRGTPPRLRRPARRAGIPSTTTGSASGPMLPHLPRTPPHDLETPHTQTRTRGRGRALCRDHPFAGPRPDPAASPALPLPPGEPQRSGSPACPCAASPLSRGISFPPSPRLLGHPRPRRRTLRSLALVRVFLDPVAVAPAPPPPLCHLPRDVPGRRDRPPRPHSPVLCLQPQSRSQHVLLSTGVVVLDLPSWGDVNTTLMAVAQLSSPRPTAAARGDTGTIAISPAGHSRGWSAPGPGPRAASHREHRLLPSAPLGTPVVAGTAEGCPSS